MNVKIELDERPRRPFSKWVLLGVSTMAKSRPYCLREGINTVGGGKSQDCRMPSAYISKTHCQIAVNDNEVILTDHSSNGTYVNGIWCLKNRLVLQDGDVLRFGFRNENYDINDSRFFVYKLTLMHASDAIHLSDDEEDNDVKRIKLANDTTVHDAHDEVEDMDLCAHLNPAEHIPVPHYAGTQNKWKKDETLVLPSTSSGIVPPLSVDSEIRMGIKEEVSWLFHEFEKTSKVAPAIKVVGTVDLCDDDDAEESPLPISVPRIKRRNEASEDPFKNTVGCHSPAMSTKPQLQKPRLAEAEKNRLVSEVTTNPLLLKTKAHITSQSRAQKLALNMLGIDDINTSQSPTVKQFNSSVKTTQKRGTPTDNIILDEDLPCDLSRHENDFVSEITSWSAKWLVERRIDAPVGDSDIVSRELPAKFGTISEYITTMSTFLKLELYLDILATPDLMSTNRAIFTQLLAVKYVERNNEKRIACICEAEAPNKMFNLKLYIDHLVLVKHAHGRFLAVVTKIDYTKIAADESKLKIHFNIETTSKLDNENLKISNMKHISIESIFSIRLEMDMYTAIMNISRSPLCSHILYPTMREDRRLTENMTLAEVTKYITELCTESLLANTNAVYLVEGAFGTGKTMVLLNSILRLREEDRWNSKRIVICGASNASLDRIAGSIQLLHKNIVRFGNVESINELVRNTAVQFDSTSKADVNKVDQADIVVTTPNLVSYLMRFSTKPFSLCFVDECSLLSEATILLLLKLRPEVLLLFGDRRVFAAHSVGTLQRDCRFRRSLFNRIIDSLGPRYGLFVPALKTQYRMHMDIFAWPNFHFYDDEITTALAPQQKYCPLKPYTVLKFKQDHDEITIIKQVINACMEYAVPEEFSYGVIAAFSHTRNQLSSKADIHPEVEISSFDCFLGEEKDIIIITGIKSSNFEIPVTRTMINVALTRARLALIFCANFSAVESLPTWKSFLGDAQHRKCLFEIEKDKFSEKHFTQLILK